MWVRFAFIGSLLTPLLHVVVLAVNGLDPAATTISQLSQHELAWLHGLELVLFGFAHIALARGIRDVDGGRLWRLARTLLVATGAGVIFLAWYFAFTDGVTLASTAAKVPLWIVASLQGCVIAVLRPGLARLSMPLGRASAVALAIWMLLIPLTLFVSDAWQGAYERTVAAVYAGWMIGVTAVLLRLRSSASPQGE
ncbi:MAG: DUF998 domain-containing protein [Myxococcota bacterium]